MTSLEQNLTQYAAYHRDRRNLLTHFAGIPMIVFALVLALATAGVPAGDFEITAAAVACVALAGYYFALDLAFGVAMSVTFFLMCAGASEIIARTSDPAALGIALGLFAAGWALQFLGHRFEGMKPAFFDDVRQLFIGPLFVCAEIFFLLGERAPLRRRIEERVGPTVARRDGRPLPLDAATQRSE